MTSPTRSPKDLRNIICNQTDSVGDTNNIKKLKALSGDDQSECSMLRSRIEEQGKLICFLKQRADEHLKRSNVLEETNKELELLRAHVLEQNKEKTHTCQMLETRFNELADNHLQMIKFKDEYKLKNQHLSIENKILKEENKKLFSAAIEERDAEIMKLLTKLKESEEKLEAANTCNCKLRDEFTLSVQHHELEKGKLQDELEILRKKFNLAHMELETLKSEKSQAISCHTDSIESLKKEKDAMLKEVMERGKLLQDKQKDIERLKAELCTKDQKLINLENEFSRKQDLVNKDLRVKRLQVEKDEAETEVSKLRVEFEAFRVHSNKLLSQEKELNSKMRNNVFI